MSEKSNVVSLVNELVETCKDAEKGFHDAAMDVKEQNLRDIFLTHSRQMAQFGKTLQEEVVRLGGAPKDHGTLAGTLHRTWMDLRAAINRHDAKLVLTECERGESAVLAHYERALETTLPQDIKDVVERQFVEILVARNHIRDLEYPNESRSSDKKTYNPLSTE